MIDIIFANIMKNFELSKYIAIKETFHSQHLKYIHFYFVKL